MSNAWKRRGVDPPPAPLRAPRGSEQGCGPRAPHRVAELDEHIRAVYSLARTMLGDRRAAGDLTMAVLGDALRGAQDPANLLLETHRRAAGYLRCVRRRRPPAAMPSPAPTALQELDAIGGEALRLMLLRGYTFGEAAHRLGRSRDEIARAVRAAITDHRGRSRRG